MKIKAPAKINIGLNVVRKRADGYHDLQTIFYPIALCDEITITPANNFKFESSDKLLEQDEKNIIVKAVRLLEAESGKKIHEEIYLKKNIPVGAGLGGGSSDAAAVLNYFNEHYGLNISLNRLKQIALKLGSDVPFFLNPLPSFARSRGEILEPINLKIPYPVLIVNPGIHIPTGKAFDKITPAEPSVDIKKMMLSTPDYSQLKEYITNDFESIIFDLYPEIGEIKSSMYYMGALFSLMTGTGSTVFGIFPDINSASAAEKKFREKYFTYISISQF